MSFLFGTPRQTLKDESLSHLTTPNTLRKNNTVLQTPSQAAAQYRRNNRLFLLSLSSLLISAGMFIFLMVLTTRRKEPLPKWWIVSIAECLTAGFGLLAAVFMFMIGREAGMKAWRIAAWVGGVFVGIVLAVIAVVVGERWILERL